MFQGCLQADTRRCVSGRPTLLLSFKVGSLKPALELKAAVKVKGTGPNPEDPFSVTVRVLGGGEGAVVLHEWTTGPQTATASWSPIDHWIVLSGESVTSGAQLPLMPPVRCPLRLKLLS